MAIDQSQFITGSAQATSSINVVFSSAVTAGNLIVACWSGWGNVANHTFSSVSDKTNAGLYTNACVSTLATSTDTQCGIAYKLNISSGGAGSTFRVSLNSLGGNADMSLIVSEFSGGPFAVGSTGSSQNAGSSICQGPALTASSTPCLFVFNGTHASSGGAVRSSVNDGVLIAQLNANNATGQILFAGYSTNSSVTQQPAFFISTGTPGWVANTVVFTGLGTGGGAAALFKPPTFTMMGFQ
jgi:hypothetical protein